MKRKDGIPRTTIHMGAGVFTLTSTLNGITAKVDLNSEAQGRTHGIAEWLCQLHDICYEVPAVMKRKRGRPRKTVQAIIEMPPLPVAKWQHLEAL